VSVRVEKRASRFGSDVRYRTNRKGSAANFLTYVALMRASLKRGSTLFVVFQRLSVLAGVETHRADLHRGPQAHFAFTRCTRLGFI
jgi:hypothetical protein